MTGLMATTDTEPESSLQCIDAYLSAVLTDEGPWRDRDP